VLENNAKGSRCAVIWVAWFIQDNAVSLLHGVGVISVGEEGSELRWKELLVGFVEPLPDRVGDPTWARG